MNDLLIKALITVMVIDAGMHFYYAYKKNVYQSLRFLTLTVLMAVSVGAALTKQEIDNVWEKMTIIEQQTLCTFFCIRLAFLFLLRDRI